MKKKGTVFLVTLILLGLVVIASAALSLMLTRDAFTVKRLKASTQAYYLAEAGIEEAIEKLWSSSFSSAGFPIIDNNYLGTGNKVRVELDTSKYSSDDILLIRSTGTVRSILRTLKVEIKANVSPSFNYVILSNGKIFVTQRSDVYCNAATGIHSNSSAKGGFFSTSAIDVVGFFYDCYVYGNASAVGLVRARRHGHITGSKSSKASSVSLPVFDATFFSYYYDLANTSGDVYTPAGGIQYFAGNLTPANGVVWVNGEVRITGNVRLNGCLVATGDINVNRWSRGTFTQNQIGNLPSLMSRGGDIWVWDPVTLNGLVYAAGDITIFSLFGQSGDMHINGSIMSGGNATIADRTNLNYIKQNPPGLGASPLGWILNWSE